MSAKAGVGVLGVVLLAVLVALTVASWTPASAVSSSQPINFPHNIHAQQYKMDCQYCHADARRSAHAGLPSVTRCMGCHKITAADRPEIKKLVGYSGQDETCHGPVETMTTVAATTGANLGNDLLNLVGLSPKPPALTMGWCIECHQQQNATAGNQAPIDCVACHH
jgi:hypothetical protein